MNYDNEKFSEVLEKIGNDRLLLLDFGKFDKRIIHTYAKTSTKVFIMHLNH